MSSKIKVVAWVCIALPLLGIVLYVCLFITGTMFLSESLARRLSPAVYPGSVLVTVRESGGPRYRQEHRVYHTTDDIYRVVAYMESQVPGFKRALNAECPAKAAFANGVVDQSIIASFNGWLTVGDSRSLPWVSVKIQERCEQPGYVSIDVTIDWPSE